MSIERHHQPEQDRQPCERCRLLGGQAAKVTTGSENYRNNFLSPFPDDRTPEERAAQWEETKRHMDKAGSSFPGKSFSQTAEELETKDRDFIRAMLKRWKESQE